MRDAISGVSASSCTSACTATPPSYPKRAGARPRNETSSITSRPSRSPLAPSCRGGAWISSRASSASRVAASARAATGTWNRNASRRSWKTGHASGAATTGRVARYTPTTPRTSKRTSGSGTYHGIGSTSSRRPSSRKSAASRTRTTSTRKRPYPTGRIRSRRALPRRITWPVAAITPLLLPRVVATLVRLLYSEYTAEARQVQRR